MREDQGKGVATQRPRETYLKKSLLVLGTKTRPEDQKEGKGKGGKEAWEIGEVQMIGAF